MTKRELITLLRSDCDHKRYSCEEIGCVMARVIPEVERLYGVEAEWSRRAALAEGEAGLLASRLETEVYVLETALSVSRSGVLGGTRSSRG